MLEKKTKKNVVVEDGMVSEEEKWHVVRLRV
jgi:hypothetical protein